MYQDNYYSSVTIPQRSLSRSIRGSGNIRAHTRITANLSRKGKKLKRGDSMSCQEVLLRLWKEKNDMRMVGTVHNATMQATLNTYVEKGGKKHHPVSLSATST
jgi:hypothetical protein